MPKFRFELEAVLRARVATERQRQLVVAQIESQRVALEDQIRAAQRAIRDSKEALRDRLHAERSRSELGDAAPAPVDLRSARQEAAGALAMVARAQHLAIRLAGVHERLDAARLELLAAAKDRKAVETLRDRRYEAWKDALKRREEAAADELATMAHARREDDGSREAA